MLNSKGNYCFLGIALAYFVIAVVQMRTDALLPAWLYVTIAFASLSASILECTKAVVRFLIWTCQQIIVLQKNMKEMLETSDMHDNNNDKSCTTDKQEEERRIDEIIEEKQMDIKKTQRFLSIISRIEIVFVTLMIVLSPLKQIPYDAFTTKAINTVTIVTFGMLFLTVFIESLHDDYEQSANLLLVKVKNMR